MKIMCSIFGHKYYVYAKPTESWSVGIRWLKCKRCKGNFIINDVVKCLIPMDFEMEDMYRWTTKEA